LEQKIFQERFESVDTRELGLRKATEHGSRFALFMESYEIYSETSASSRCYLSNIPVSQPNPLGWIYAKNFKHREAFDYM